jgi:C-terminal processing protease CtpA/Prc
MRVLLSAVALVAILAACVPQVGPIGATARPTNTPDIQRAKLDIVYSAFTDQDVHKVSSKKALEMALEAVRAEARRVGGKADVPTPEFQDVQETVLPDFRKFADAVSKIAETTPELSGDEIAVAAIRGMLKASPDCHTYYFDGRRHDSRPVEETGVANPSPPQGQVVAQPDEAGLTARILDGGVAYVRWREFRITGTYDIRAKVKIVLEQAVAAGAKAWLFDMRGNVGGNGPELIASYFLNGEGLMEVHLRNGKAGVRSANKDFQLPAQFQLPIALIQNDQGGSGPEVFALFLKEAKRGTIFGKKSVGCLGSTSPTTLSDGSTIFIAVEEYIGAVTGTRYNNAGIVPDIAVDDATAIEVAARHLREQIAKGR